MLFMLSHPCVIQYAFLQVVSLYIQYAFSLETAYAIIQYEFRKVMLLIKQYAFREVLLDFIAIFLDLPATLQHVLR